jgi:hypothetical protein
MQSTDMSQATKDGLMRSLGTAKAQKPTQASLIDALVPEEKRATSAVIAKMHLASAKAKLKIQQKKESQAQIEKETEAEAETEAETETETETETEVAVTALVLNVDDVDQNEIQPPPAVFQPAASGSDERRPPTPPGASPLGGMPTSAENTDLDHSGLSPPPPPPPPPAAAAATSATTSSAAGSLFNYSFIKQVTVSGSENSEKEQEHSD